MADQEVHHGWYYTFDYLDPAIEDATNSAGRDVVHLHAYNRLTGKYKIIKTVTAPRVYRLNYRSINWNEDQTKFELVVSFTQV